MFAYLLIPLPALAGMIAAATSPAITSTSELSPPGWVYGVVWSLLYVLLGLSWFLTAPEGFAMHLALVWVLFLWIPVYTRWSKKLAALVILASLATTLATVALYEAWILLPLATWLLGAVVINSDEAFRWYSGPPPPPQTRPTSPP